MRRKGPLIELAVVALLLAASPDAAARTGEQALTITEPSSILGHAFVDRILTATPGEWVPEAGATPTYQWRRCSGPSLDSCTDIPGATDPSRRYRIADEDGGYMLRVRLTVTRDAESVFAHSDSTAPVPPEPPSSTARPMISGIVREGQVLTASPGEWRGTPPLSFGYVWQRCDEDGNDCKPVHAGSASYTLSAADVGNTVRVIVTATNAAGSSSETSRPTNRVGRALLLSAEPPTIMGIAEVDRWLTATPGQWITTGPVDFLYLWLRCRGDGSGCEPIPGADSATYQVRLLDIGFRLRVRVTAIGDGDAGSVTRESALTDLVPAPSGVLPFTQGGGTAPEAIAAFMQPFPRIRIKGYYTPSGAVVQLLTIRGAAGARIALACRGADCPFRHRVRRGRQRVRVRSLERSYHAGTRLTIRVTKAALIGKYTRIVIRANRAPKRRDRCLMPDSTRPVLCPSGG
jgi:hypothetical protein